MDYIIRLWSSPNGAQALYPSTVGSEGSPGSVKPVQHIAPIFKVQVIQAFVQATWTRSQFGTGKPTYATTDPTKLWLKYNPTLQPTLACKYNQAQLLKSFGKL